MESNFYLDLPVL